MPNYPKAIAVCAAAVAGVFAATPATPTAANSYLVHNLVSDLPSMADYEDANLVNPWGLATTASSPFWLGNNGTGTSTLYGTTGAPVALVVTVPTPTASTGGAVSGVIANTTTSFTVATGKAASFIFCTEDGTVSGWNSSVNPSAAIVTVDNSAANSVFKGCAIGGTSTAPVLYVTDFHNGVVDMFDANYKPISPAAGAFADSAIPAGFAPFNIMNLGGNLYVTYAKQDAAKHDDDAGPGNGFVDVYDFSGNLVTHLISEGALNSPWGMQIAPATFGQFGGALLVSNFGDGTINAFDPAKGTQLGTLQDPTGHNLTIPGLWGLLFGNGGKGGDRTTLYFTAGIPGPYGEPPESHGLFGSIQPPPQFTTAVNGASFQAPLAPNTWASIIGGALATTSRSWASTDFSGALLPTTIDGVSVTVNGSPAAIDYVGPSQIDFLVPDNAATGSAQIQVNNNDQISAVANVTLQSAAPAFFWLTGNKYIVATHADGALAGPTTLITGVTTPVMPGETIVLYGTGFGATSSTPPPNATFPDPLALATLPTVTIGGAPATVVYAGLIEPGLYQLNVEVPVTLAAGDAAVVAIAGGQQSQANAFLAVM
ncbi:MAG TPA: TIGR03118 family protein [Bryobacteraceae bacterium]|nr:TIGR03118 family protein [Bryobacteraceae bacterium]